MRRSAATAAGAPRIRIIQYAMYGDRGVWIAKKLRSLWRPGLRHQDHLRRDAAGPSCSILRNGSGRGPVPMRQSVDQERQRRDRQVQPQQVDDDHRPLGPVAVGVRDLHRARRTGPCSPSASDEQMQRIAQPRQTLRLPAGVRQTWRQRTSKRPPGGRVATFGRGVTASRVCPRTRRLGLGRLPLHGCP